MIKRFTANLIRNILGLFGYSVIPTSMVQKWHTSPEGYGRKTELLSPDAESYLRPDHPELLSLRDRYQTFDSQVTVPLVWSEDRINGEDLQYFRGSNVYLFQTGSMNRNLMGYLLQAYYIRVNDQLNLWDTLQEEGDFGVVLFQADNKIISRDLLDSIQEINYLSENLSGFSWEGANILDIGAGYGRLAYRMVKGMPMLGKYICTDAVPLSTFVCDYYLNSKAISDRAVSVPLDQIQDTLEQIEVELAVNIHSFSECRLEAIDWWLSLLARHQVPYLFIVPNSKHGLLTIDRKDFQPIIEKHGYRNISVDPKYRDPEMQMHAANPSIYHLFKLD